MIIRMIPTTTGTPIVISIRLLLIMSAGGVVTAKEVGIKLVIKNEDEHKNTGVADY